MLPSAHSPVPVLLVDDESQTDISENIGKLPHLIPRERSAARADDMFHRSTAFSGRADRSQPKDFLVTCFVTTSPRFVRPDGERFPAFTFNVRYVPSSPQHRSAASLEVYQLVGGADLFDRVALGIPSLESDVEGSLLDKIRRTEAVCAEYDMQFNQVAGATLAFSTFCYAVRRIWS